MNVCTKHQDVACGPVHRNMAETKKVKFKGDPVKIGFFLWNMFTNVPMVKDYLHMQ